MTCGPKSDDFGYTAVVLRFHPRLFQTRTSMIIRLPEDLARYAEGAQACDVPGRTVADCMAGLIAQFPALAPRVLDADGAFFSYLPAFLNGHKLPPGAAGQTPVEAGDVLELVVMVSGG